jgi:hypothetical protein
VIFLPFSLFFKPVAEFFSSLDIYIQDDMDVAMALAYQSARLQIIEMREDGVAVDKLKPIFAKLERYKDQYIANKDQYRKPKDTFRTTPYKKFFVAFKGFVEETNGMPNISWPQALKNKVQATVKVFRLGLTLIPSAIELVKTVMLIKDPAGQNVPMTAAIFQGARKLSKLNRVSIRISGANNLPTKTDLQTVNIFVASHRHGLNDVMSVAGLNNDSIVLFGAARNFLPSVLNKIFGMKDKIINRMNENLGFIVVGKGAKPEPVEKALKILKESSVRNFLIFPGGRLPEGLGATMGVREKFFAEYGLIHSIENAGYKVNLIPLAFPDNARLFDDTSFLFENAPEELLVEVYPMIDDHTRRVIVKAAGPESLGLLLRFGLTESLHTNDTLVWGQVRADRLVNTIDRFVTQNTSDKSFCARRLKSLKATADF